MDPHRFQGSCVASHKLQWMTGSRLLIVHGKLTGIAEVHLQGFLLADGLLVGRLLRL